MSEAIQKRLTDFENIVEERPGEALDELQEVIADLNEALTDHQESAHALIRNGTKTSPVECRNSRKVRWFCNGPQPLRWRFGNRSDADGSSLSVNRYGRDQPGTVPHIQC